MGEVVWWTRGWWGVETLRVWLCLLSGKEDIPFLKGIGPRFINLPACEQWRRLKRALAMALGVLFGKDILGFGIDCSNRAIIV